MKPAVFPTRRAAFVLLEAMLGVAIFAVGVIALGACVNNCLSAEAARAQDQRVRLALSNRMAEIEAGAVILEETKTEKLKGLFEGITLKQTRKVLDKKNEDDQELRELYTVTLEASWMNGTQSQSKDLSFYVLRTR